MKLVVELHLGDIHVHVHQAEDKIVLERILQTLSILVQKENVIMRDLTVLEADVKANDDAVQSAVLLLQGLKTALDEAGTDPVKLKALSDHLEANTGALAAAVVANTPVA